MNIIREFLWTCQSKWHIMRVCYKHRSPVCIRNNLIYCILSYSVFRSECMLRVCIVFQVILFIHFGFFVCVCMCFLNFHSGGYLEVISTFQLYLLEFYLNLRISSETTPEALLASWVLIWIHSRLCDCSKLKRAKHCK